MATLTIEISGPVMEALRKMTSKRGGDDTPEAIPAEMIQRFLREEAALLDDLEELDSPAPPLGNSQ